MGSALIEIDSKKRGAFAIVFNKEGKVLLCHRRDYDLWNLPGGGVLPGEEPLDGAVREVFEETGANVTILRKGHTYIRPNQGNTVYTFVGKTNDTIKTSDESDNTRFFSLNDLPKNLIPSHVQRIKDVLEKPSPCVMTEIDYSLPELVRMVDEHKENINLGDFQKRVDEIIKTTPAAAKGR